MVLHCGHSFLFPRVLSQHSSQWTCQHWMDVRGIVYESMQMRHLYRSPRRICFSSSRIRAFRASIVVAVDSSSVTFSISLFLQVRGAFEEEEEEEDDEGVLGSVLLLSPLLVEGISSFAHLENSGEIGRAHV